MISCEIMNWNPGITYFSKLTKQTHKTRGTTVLYSNQKSNTSPIRYNSSTSPLILSRNSRYVSPLSRLFQSGNSQMEIGSEVNFFTGFQSE